MQKPLLSILLLFISITSFSQIKGIITDSKNEPLPFVNVFIENTYKGTTTNDAGFYELNITEKKSYNIVFQYLGFKTLKRTQRLLSNITFHCQHKFCNTTEMKK